MLEHVFGDVARASPPAKLTLLLGFRRRAMPLPLSNAGARTGRIRNPPATRQASCRVDTDQPLSVPCGCAIRPGRPHPQPRCRSLRHLPRRSGHSLETLRGTQQSCSYSIFRAEARYVEQDRLKNRFLHLGLMAMPAGAEMPWLTVCRYVPLLFSSVSVLLPLLAIQIFPGASIAIALGALMVLAPVNAELL